MAKRKVVTKKETTKDSGELDLNPKDSEFVKEVIDEYSGVQNSSKVIDRTIEPVEPDVVEKVSKEDLQDHYDQEVKDLLKEMGNIQSRYQQLGRTNKAKSLRNQKRIIQGLYKEWK